jgi:riboflavin kinase
MLHDGETMRYSGTSQLCLSSPHDNMVVSDGSSIDPPTVVGKDRSSSISSEQEHLQRQLQVFASGNAIKFFSNRDEEVTPELEPVYRGLCGTILTSILDGRQATTTATTQNHDEDGGDNTSEERGDDGPIVLTILDVACGTGVLWEFLIDEANKRSNLVLHITGVDLSPSMVTSGQDRSKELLTKSQEGSGGGSSHMIHVVQQDIVTYCRHHLNGEHTLAGPYDAVILNACFGNFWDPRQVLESIAPITTGTVCISHPLGAKFVRELHEKDPITVPHVLPETPYEVLEWTQGLPLLLVSSTTMQSAVTLSGSSSFSSYNSDGYYLATLRSTRARLLPTILRYRGVVDRGYGRGGKKLGVPTANLPASLFQNALEDVSTGVYFGWATLEGQERQEVYKAVVNVGYSPTFEGQENREKIIEAHLIVVDSGRATLPDFYGVPLRLQLIGFLREERKFDSFAQLIAQIHADVIDAKSSLDYFPYLACSNDPFLIIGDTESPKSITPSTWVGNGGGDEVASWEVGPILEFLKGVL